MFESFIRNVENIVWNLVGFVISISIACFIVGVFIPAGVKKWIKDKFIKKEEK